MIYKRIADGKHLIEWTDSEMIYRRYTVVDTSEPSAVWKAERLVNRFQVSAETKAALEQRWEQQGRMIRTG